jgi:hypothetical protein
MFSWIIWAGVLLYVIDDLFDMGVFRPIKRNERMNSLEEQLGVLEARVTAHAQNHNNHGKPGPGSSLPETDSVTNKTIDPWQKQSWVPWANRDQGDKSTI